MTRAQAPGAAAQAAAATWRAASASEGPDVIVSRAGATTIAELTAAGRAAILIPLPTAADDHQKKNAEVLARAGAAELIEQKDLTGDALAARVLALAHDAGRRRAIAEAARRFARPDAARVIVDRALELAHASERGPGGQC